MYKRQGLDTGTLQFLYGVLGGLGLQLTGSCQVGDISKVDAQGVLSQFPLQLTDAFQIDVYKRQVPSGFRPDR